MKTALQLAVLLAGLSGAALAEPPADVRAAPSCKHCGMDREKFAHSRMVVDYEDGSSVGLCSVHCAAIELPLMLDKQVRSLQVADHGTRALVDAEKATWVVGGSVPGVMTARAKWAFADRAAAEAFVKANGGTLATFDEAMRATYADMYEDTKALRAKRKMMRARQQQHQAQPMPAAHEQPSPGGHGHGHAQPAPAQP